jgi:hypothetical protein
MHDRNRPENYNATGAITQAKDVSELFHNLFIGNERRHVKNFGPPTHDTKKQKWCLDVKTHSGPATLSHWQDHFSQKYILSVIPLLDDGTCRFACIDVDDYSIDHIQIYARASKLPLHLARSKSGGLHLFVFFKEPVPADKVIPALRVWAGMLGLTKYEVFPSSAQADAEHNTRAISMPYGATWNELYEQAFTNATGGYELPEDVLDDFDKWQITADELPQPQQVNGQDQGAKKIPLALQVAIYSVGPYPGNDRSPICASIISQLAAHDLNADEIQAVVEGHGPFVRYDENNRNLKKDVLRIHERYVTAHPNAKAKVEICTDIVPWDPSPPPPLEWSIQNMIATGSVTALWGDSGTYKSFGLWNMAVSRMFGLPFAYRQVNKRCGVLMLLAEGKADYRIRCRGALKHAGLDPNQQLPLIMANEQMLPLVHNQSAEQLHGMITKANAWLQEKFGLELGCIFVDTLSMAARFEDVYKPNEVIAVNRMLASIAEQKIDTVYTDHFPKNDKEHAAGTLHKRNSVDQIIVFKDGRMIMDKVRYGPDKVWNAYHTVTVDDGGGNSTLAISFGPTQEPGVHGIDNAVLFMSALQDVQMGFDEKIKVSEMQSLFVERHVRAQGKSGSKSKDPKEMARSAFRREMVQAVKCGLVKEEGGYVWEVKIA